MNFSSRIHPSDQESTLVLYSRLLSRELPFFETENRYLTKSSQPVWVQKFISKLPDETGEPSHLLMLVTDITCRKQFEEELRDSHALNTSILNSLTSHIAVLDEQGVIVTVNNSWREFAAENGLSSTRQGLIGVNYLDVCKNAYHQPNGEEANAAYTGIMAVLAGERKLFELEYPSHSPHRQRWFHMKVSPLEGFRRGVVVSYENITERKQAKQKLREKERMLSESQRIAHIGSWILDLKTGYISWSDEMYRICGITKEAFRRTPEAFMALIHPEDAAEMKRWINDCVNGRKMQELDFRIIWPDGTIRFIRCSGELEYDAMNVAIRAMGSAQDITERTYREQEAKKHLNELAHVARLGLMGEMASGMAHELKQPLAAISTYAQACLTFINVEKPDLILLAATLSKMQRQASRAGLIISRMREFAKSDVKRRATADINALIITCVELCNTEIKQSNIALTVELDENLPSIHVDHIQIEQVLINLIRNGIDALNSVAFQTGQRLLAIHSRLLPNRRIEVRIKDNGPGINEEQKQKILMPFYTTKSEGLGMGLSISRSLIEAHDGTLHFNSELAKGTSFYFTLPT